MLNFAYHPTSSSAVKKRKKNTAISNTQNSANLSTPSQKSPSNPVDSASSATSAAGKYRNGTYNDQGSNRIGMVEVAVTVNQE